MTEKSCYLCPRKATIINMSRVPLCANCAMEHDLIPGQTDHQKVIESSPSWDKGITEALADQAICSEWTVERLKKLWNDCELEMGGFNGSS